MKESGADRERPDDVSDATVAALGKLSEALETVEHARGMLYGWHRHRGMADLALGQAVEALGQAGHVDLADRLGRDLVGLNVLPGRWSYQVLEEYDDCYHARFVAWEERVRDELVGGRRHLFEAELKEKRRTVGVDGHEAEPGPTE